MIAYEAGSYRDRAGRVFYDHSGAVLRGLSAEAWANWSELTSTAFFQQAHANGRIIETRAWQDRLPGDLPPESATPDGSGQRWVGILHHRRVPCISYPFEWSFGMLRDAAILYLELLESALSEGFVIKDGTAYNLQWRGCQPVFIDVPSLSRLNPGQPWTGYRQFCQTFLFPLMLSAYKAIPFQPWLRGRLDGITPQECRRLMTLRDLLRRGVLTHVILHAWLESRTVLQQVDSARELASAGFHRDLIRNNVRGLLRLIRGLRNPLAKSLWSGYEHDNQYSTDDERAKSAFVTRVAAQQRWPVIWDIGCNTGHYTRLVAQHADLVLALDSDEASIERCYQQQRSAPTSEQGRILPLVVDLADSFSGLGWRGKERIGLLERSRPQLVLCLALMHHLVIGRGIPLPEFVQWLASLGAVVVLEFTSKDDPMVQALLRGRNDDYWDYELPVFERCLQQHFEVVHSEVLPMQTRRLYHAVPRNQICS